MSGTPLSTESAETAAMRYLRERGIPFRVFRHAHPPRTLEQAARERGHRVEQIVRSILFRGEARTYVLLLLPGGYRAHWPTLRKTLGMRRLTLATPDEVLQVTGAPVGAVPPWGWPHPPAHVLADQRLQRFPELSMGSGARGVALILTLDDFLRSLPAHTRWGEFGFPQSQPEKAPREEPS